MNLILPPSTIQILEKVGRSSMGNTFFSIQKEMALIQARQQELIAEGDTEESQKELARLQVVYDYLRDKYLITIKGNGRLH